ncbi:MAG: DUF721 domain-containing protein [Gaiellales bacterium]
MSELRRIDRLVARSVRLPAVDPLVSAARAVWPDAVGPQVARNSIPVRYSGDALVVHCASAVWVSELTLLESQVRERLAAVLSGTPPRLRFRVGDITGAGAAGEPTGTPVSSPSPQARAAAADLARRVSDPELRAAIERALAHGFERGS